MDRNRRKSENVGSFSNSYKLNLFSCDKLRVRLSLNATIILMDFLEIQADAVAGNDEGHSGRREDFTSTIKLLVMLNFDHEGRVEPCGVAFA